MSIATAADARGGRCLVIQLSGLDGLLRSLMALRAAQQLYPSLEISLLVHEEHAAAARKVSWIREVHAFPSSGVAGALAKGRVTEEQAVSAAAVWLKPVISDP
ncbi:MAG: hypothetical protein IT285_12370 [Bdellovibrionales bacterium]|nr:hypothetical protein [Bdellovibrionales bacterium]